MLGTLCRSLTGSATLFLFSALPAQAAPEAVPVNLRTVAQVPGPSLQTGINQAQPLTRRRIAVLDFDYSSLSNPYVTAFGGGAGAGRAVSDILINLLVRDGTYAVIERSKLEQVLREQNLGASGRIQPGTEAQLGKLLGVDALIVGSITKFNLDRQQSGFGFLGIQTGSAETTATVQLSARIVSTATGEILAVADGEAKQNQRDGQTYVLGMGGGTNTNNADTLLSSAANEALGKVSPQLAAVAPRLTTFMDPTVTATVADVTGKLITLNKGSEVGLKPGMTMNVEHIVKAVKDPETGKVLRQITSPVGTLTLTDVSAGSSQGTVNQGRFKVGDIARPSTTTYNITGTVLPPSQPVAPTNP